MRAADRKPFVGKTRRVFRQSQTAREGGLFLRESPHQLPANEHPIPRKYPPLFRQGRVWGRGLRIATASVRTDLAMTGFPWSVVHGRRATARVAPTEGYKECLAGGRTEASAPTDSLVAGEVGDREGRPHAPPSFRSPIPPGFLTSLTMISTPHAADLDTLLIFIIFL